ncbi:50S ribosomal protein L32 [Synergistales bacterium]|nr:50S ribosomal protein L32 [Synergistales bacterium]
MATPKRKTSHARTSQRKAQWLGSLRAPSTLLCPHCGEVTVSHRACPSCGWYKGRDVLKIEVAAK